MTQHFDNSPLGLIPHCVLDDILKRVKGADLMIALTCKSLRDILRKPRGGSARIPRPVRYFQTSGTVIASSARLLSWAKSLSTGGPRFIQVWNAETCAMIAATGDLEGLQWARDDSCEWDKRTCTRAAANGHLKVVQWARANGCAWDAGTCSEAARGGHLEVLQWARANGCKWNAKTIWRAAAGGHLDVLQWARANGCPEDEEDY